MLNRLWVVGARERIRILRDCIFQLRPDQPEVRREFLDAIALHRLFGTWSDHMN